MAAVRHHNSIVDRVVGCLVGGAVGDALGAGIEFDSWDTIRRVHGPQGVTDYVPAYGRVGAITDDTQMAMFTTEGLIRASIRGRAKGVCHPPTVIRHAYLRWLWTQGNGAPLTREFEVDGPDGWLCTLEELRSRRAPGNTCIGALTTGGRGTLADPPNDSKGCGGVMRAAPVGFISGSAAERFELGCEIAVLTHGHPCGYLPAGYLAAVIGGIMDGADFFDALDTADDVLRRWDHHEETAAAIARGRTLGELDQPTPEALAELGGGWTGEEALSIAIACAIGYVPFEPAVLAAVNHSGDSDSTGSITGNLLGAYYGTDDIPRRWTDRLELRTEIEQLARDAALELSGIAPEEDDEAFEAWFDRYPGW